MVPKCSVSKSMIEHQNRKLIIPMSLVCFNFTQLITAPANRSTVLLIDFFYNDIRGVNKRSYKLSLKENEHD
jgi:hypothetical protein